MASKYPSLFQPMKLGPLTLKNRIVKSGQWFLYAEPDGSCGDRIIGFYEGLAKYGPGLITIEESICEFPWGASQMPHVRLDDDKFIPGLTQARGGRPQARRAGRRADHARRTGAQLEDLRRPAQGAVEHRSAVRARAVRDRPRDDAPGSAGCHRDVGAVGPALQEGGVRRRRDSPGALRARQRVPLEAPEQAHRRVRLPEHGQPDAFRHQHHPARARAVRQGLRRRHPPEQQGVGRPARHDERGGLRDCEAVRGRPGSTTSSRRATATTPSRSARSPTS